MATAQQRIVSPQVLASREKIVDFSPDRLKAPFLLRCAALFVDYSVLLICPIGWLFAAKLFGPTGSIPAIGWTIWLMAFALFFVDFLILPLFRGQTLGKMLVGITIITTTGTSVGFWGLFRRNLLGYLLTAMTLGIGFLISAVNSSGRSLHDFVGGTCVIRGRKRPV